MKKILPFIAVFALGITACSKRSCQDMNPSSTATVVRDCTGTYLRLGAKDYNVCNLEMVAPYVAGAVVNVSFRRIAECTAANERIVCYMLHPSEGWIEVTAIR